MTKAEKRALEKYPANKTVFDKYEKQRYAFICGYIQAEKDLALTVEDIEKIDNLLWDLSSKWSDKNDNAGYFQDVLNRFYKQEEK